MRVGLLFLIIISSCILLFFKVTDIWDNYEQSSSFQFSLISSAYAQENAQDKAENTEENYADDEGGEDEENTAPEIAPTIKYTDTELDVLQRLSNRRAELEQWQKDIEIKASILSITQEKIDHKISELRKLKKQVEASLVLYNEKEDAKITSLVRIYENMKPKAAAKIFSQLDLNTLVTLAEKMGEDKVALVIAKMSPILAKNLTIKMVEHRRIKNDDK